MTHNTLRVMSAVLMASLSAGCPADENDPSTDSATDPASTETETAGASETETDPELPAECTCAGADACDVPLCDPIDFDPEGYGSTGAAESGSGTDGDTDTDGQADPNLDAITCALEALRDGTEGSISWSYSENAGQFADNGSVAIKADRAAVHSSTTLDDICFDELGQISAGTLKPASTFEACLADPDPRARFDCVRFNLGSGAVTCQEEVTNCDGV